MLRKSFFSLNRYCISQVTASLWAKVCATVTPSLCFAKKKFLRKHPSWCWNQLYNDPKVHSHWPSALNASQLLPWQQVCVGLKCCLSSQIWAGASPSPHLSHPCVQNSPRNGPTRTWGHSVSPCHPRTPALQFPSLVLGCFSVFFLMANKPRGEASGLGDPTPVCEQQQTSW